MKEKRTDSDSKDMLAAKIILSACKEIPLDRIDELSKAKKVCEKKEKIFLKSLSEEQKDLYSALNFARKDYHEKFLSAFESDYFRIKG